MPKSKSSLMRRHQEVLMKAASKAPTMATSKRLLLAKAATSKAAAWRTRASSKMAAVPQAIVGATARRFTKGFSKEQIERVLAEVVPSCMTVIKCRGQSMQFEKAPEGQHPARKKQHMAEGWGAQYS
ncbi:unnamed protein product [Effrenium voratum]|nr:unnamed protein product [Effrenium voratum]